MPSPTATAAWSGASCASMPTARSAAWSAAFTATRRRCDGSSSRRRAGDDDALRLRAGLRQPVGALDGRRVEAGRGRIPGSGRPARLEPANLATRRVEVRRIEPRLERALDRRPFRIGDRIPRGVAVAALVDDGLAEDAFEGEAEAQRRGSGGRVQVIALPFEAP